MHYCQVQQFPLLCDCRHIHTPLWLKSLLEAEHASHIEMVLNAFRRFNVRLSKEKCVWGVESIEFLGRIVSHGSVSHAQSYLDPILKRAPPATLDEMRGWLGSINFVAGHIPQISRVLRPFFEMVGEVGRQRKKRARLPWTDDLRRQFVEAQLWIEEHYQPTMLPDNSTPWRMYTDASREGMGAALLQENPSSKKWEPVAFFSKVWKCPSSYGVRDLELKAIHESIKHWQGFLRYGQPITVYSDHQSLSKTLVPTTTTTTAPVDHWLAHLSQYNLTITYVKGEKNFLADILSRKVEMRLTQAVGCLSHERRRGEGDCAQ